ncbi:MAG TPA: hypothetical protein VMM93_10520 [Vicinamibacterales bacterium]|nr:hypothetical protein [Vicinamibacterales bacterium]
MAGFGLLKKLRPSGDDRAFGATAEKLRRQGQATRAVEVCRTGLEKHSEQLSARVTLGWALIDLALYEEARPEFEYVLRRAPDNLQAIRGMAHLHDHIETSAALSAEFPGDWPPRSEDIARAVAGSDELPATDDAPALAFEEPTWSEPPVVDAAEVAVEAAAGLLDEAEALDELAAEAEAQAGAAGVGPIEPVNLEADAEVSLDAIATELTSAGSDAGEAEPEAVVLDEDLPAAGLDEAFGGESSEEDRGALHALEDLLVRSQVRREQTSKDSAA